MKRRTFSFLVASPLLLTAGCVASVDSNDMPAPEHVQEAKQALTPAYVGCYTDAATRALPNLLISSGATVESCMAAAQQAGYSYAGLEYGGECRAGNVLGYSQVSDSDCNMPCSANAAETCGGLWRNSVWRNVVNSEPMPYLGCYIDAASRALPNLLISSGATVESCTAAAQQAGYPYAGLEYGGECRAGNLVGYAKVSDSQCNMPCSANAGEMCGALWRNSVYGVAMPYQGCYTDDPSRALPNLLMPSGATVESCTAAAQQAGYLYAGLEYGGECRAGNVLGDSKVSDAQCNMPCSANANEMCGALWRNSVYGNGPTTTYTIPGSGGTYGGGYLTLLSANGDFELYITCNYGAAGDDEAFFFAESPSVTAGQVQVSVAIQGQPTETFNDLAYDMGGQDRAFASTNFQGAWPWLGVFTAVEGGKTTQWSVSASGSAGGDCTVTVTANGGGSGFVTRP
jgi:sulfur relay (sulfurtransferase) complex TusBCD TusD component (DsrE family)